MAVLSNFVLISHRFITNQLTRLKTRDFRTGGSLWRRFSEFTWSGNDFYTSLKRTQQLQEETNSPSSCCQLRNLLDASSSSRKAEWHNREWLKLTGCGSWRWINQYITQIRLDVHVLLTWPLAGADMASRRRLSPVLKTCNAKFIKTDAG